MESFNNVLNGEEVLADHIAKSLRDLSSLSNLDIENEKEHIASTRTEDAILLLDTTLTPELEAEGFAREIVRRIQSMRKELDLDVEQQISTTVSIPKEKLNSLKDWDKYIKEETRSQVLIYEEKPIGKLVKTWDIDEIKVTIGVDT